VFPGTEMLTYAECSRPPMFKLESSEEARLRKALEECEAGRELLSSQLSELNATNAELRRQIEGLEEEVQNLLSQVAALNETLLELRAENARLAATANTYLAAAAVATPAALVVGLLLGRRLRRS